MHAKEVAAHLHCQRRAEGAVVVPWVPKALERLVDSLHRRVVGPDLASKQDGLVGPTDVVALQQTSHSVGLHPRVSLLEP